MTPWTGDRPIARHVPTRDGRAQKSNADVKSMPRKGFEPIIPGFKWSDIIRALDRIISLSSSSSSSSHPLVLLQWCTQPLRLQVSDSSTFLTMCDAPEYICFVENLTNAFCYFSLGSPTPIVSPILQVDLVHICSIHNCPKSPKN